MKPIIRTEGFAQAKDILDQLPNNMQKKLLRQALRASSRPMLAAAKREAPRRTGKLANMLRIVNYRKVQSRSEVAVAIKHVFNTSKSGKVNQYYGKFVHEGTNERVAKRGKVFVFENEQGEKVFTRKAKAMTPNPYIQRAYDANVEGLIMHFGNDLAGGIDKFVAKKFKPVAR